MTTHATDAIISEHSNLINQPAMAFYLPLAYFITIVHTYIIIKIYTYILTCYMCVSTT